MLIDQLRACALPLNAMRLALAMVVLVSHSWPLGGYCCEPGFPGLLVAPSTTWGGFAVGGFFALSGVLVTMSAQRKTAGGFIAARARRLYPAYVAVLVVAAVGLAPVIYGLTHGTLSGYFHFGPGGPVVYVARNLLFPFGLQFGINDVFQQTTPWGFETGASVINGSLWTLPIEVRAYAVALVVTLIGRKIGSTRTAMAVLASTGVLLLINAQRPGALDGLMPEYMPVGSLELLFVFMCGSAIATRAEHLTLSPILGFIAICIFFATTVIGGPIFTSIGLGSLALVLPFLAIHLPVTPFRSFRNDFSYGAYVWAFPVQQTLAFFDINSFGFLMYTLISALVTLPLAALSWFFVERPFLSNKQLPVLAKSEPRKNDGASV